MVNLQLNASFIPKKRYKILFYSTKIKMICCKQNTNDMNRLVAHDVEAIQSTTHLMIPSSSNDQANDHADVQFQYEIN